MNKKLLSSILLLITALIWGSAFVAQKNGMELIEPFTFNGIRTFIGGLVLIPVVAIISAKQKKNPLEEPKDESALSKIERKFGKNITYVGGICCGVALFVASNLQQFGINGTTVGKAGFITTLYIAFVPIISIILRKRVRPIMWLCVVLGVVGFWMLSMTTDSLDVSTGDLLCLAGSLGFACHIMVIDYFSPKCDGVKMSCVQFLVAGFLGIICMFIFENPNIDAILEAWMPILYAGALSCGVAYTLQIIAQKWANPTIASLLMSLESVFAAISGALFLGETMTGRQLTGCIIIFSAVIISNLPEKKAKLPNHN